MGGSVVSAAVSREEEAEGLCDVNQWESYYVGCSTKVVVRSVHSSVLIQGEQKCGQVESSRSHYSKARAGDPGLVLFID